MKFTDDTKAVKEFSSNYFGYGVHKVKIGLIENGGQGDDEKEYVELTLLGDDGQEDTARVWFTTDKAANYSFNILREIAVHNAKEADKDKARNAVDACQDTNELVELFNERLVGTGECWFTVYPSPTRTYQAADGSTKKSIDKNIYGYEPKLRTDLLPAQEPVAEVTGNETQEDIAAGIPDAWK